ncbi:MAG: glycosyltransferase, partial [Bryocella sp.]
MKRVLMVAYHFPPLSGSSGVQRTLRFVRHLPQFGWEPIVLSAHPRAYATTSADLLAQVPSDTVVRRAFALDTARHLSIAGRYVASMARPDRWASWKFDGVRQGMRLVRKYKPDVIWSTFPIATAHSIGAELHRRSGIPWVADFRDPMAQTGYPSDPVTWRYYKAIEEHAVTNAAFSTFTTPGAARIYRERYPQSAERIVVLENGYDESSFIDAEAFNDQLSPLNPNVLTLLHSGIVYPHERDPSQFFAALRHLADEGHLSLAQLKVRFRSAVHDDLLHQLAAQYGVEEFIETLPAIGYQDALREILRADAL